jgi:predicted nucleic acid-binding protein
MPDAVSDSSPLIHLAKIEALELISRLYSRTLIPPAVWHEVVEESDGRPGAVEMQRAVAAGWMVKQAAENKALVIALRQTLDNGEAEAIALATELQPEVVLLDDKLARRMAQRLGVPVTGTLGVLLRSKQLGLVVELRSLIIRLQSEGDYRVSRESVYSQLEGRHDLADNQLERCGFA